MGSARIYREVATYLCTRVCETNFYLFIYLIFFSTLVIT